jgi:hypothetical protein
MKIRTTAPVLTSNSPFFRSKKYLHLILDIPFGVGTQCTKSSIPWRKSVTTNFYFLLFILRPLSYRFRQIMAIIRRHKNIFSFSLMILESSWICKICKVFNLTFMDFLQCFLFIMNMKTYCRRIMRTNDRVHLHFAQAISGRGTHADEGSKSAAYTANKINVSIFKNILILLTCFHRYKCGQYSWNSLYNSVFSHYVWYSSERCLVWNKVQFLYIFMTITE